MTRKQAENFVEMLMIISVIVVMILVATGTVESIVFLTGNIAIFVIGLVCYKILDKINERES